METNPYKQLAEKLDAMPNGFPATQDGVELRILQKLFTPEEAELTARLTTHFESVDEFASRTGDSSIRLRSLLKRLARAGLIEVGRSEAGLKYRLLPFVVGIYEMQVSTLDPELAGLFETYFGLFDRSNLS